MSTPHGHPDYQGFAATTGPNYFPALNQVLNPGHNIGPVVPVTSWGSLLISVSPTAGFGILTVNHSLDAAGTQIVSTDQWAITPQHQPIIRTPLRGLYVSIDIQVNSGGAMPAQTYATLQSGTAERISYPVATQEVDQEARVLAAGGVDTFQFNRVVAGFGWLYFFQSDGAHNNLTLTLDAMTSSGALNFHVFRIDSTALPLNQLLLIPDFIIQVKIANNDAVNPHTYDYTFFVPEQ